MPITSEQLVAAIKAKLEADEAIVNDLSGGCGQNFEVKIVSKVFRGKTLLQRHRLVNETLKEEIASIHAFSQKTHTPEEWEAEKAKLQQPSVGV